MLRWLLPLFASVLAGLGLLSVFPAPAWVDWRLALLAGEFGYWLALAALALAGAAFLRIKGVPGTAAGIGFLAAAALLTLPCLEAWRIGRWLPGRLAAAFGPVGVTRAPFSIGALFRPGEAASRPSTLRYEGMLELDFYRAPGRQPAAAVIVIHGGGWDNGERGQIPGFNQWLVRQGFAVADISYRLAPASPWPAQRADVLAAIAFLKARGPSLGVDPGRLVLFGRSAGGQIAEAVAYGAHDPAIRGVIAFYAPADLNFAWAYAREDDVLRSPRLLRQYLGGTPATARPAYDSASGILQASPDSPPTLLLHGRLDTLVWHRQSERLDARLRELGVPHAFLSLPWATHALEFNLNGPGGQLACFSVGWFLKAVTR